MHGFTFHDGLGRAARLACLASAWWPLMACQPTAPSGPSTPVASASGVARNDRSAQEQLWRANPSPSKGMEAAFEIHGSPGPFAEVRGDVAYQATNCNYVTSEWAGARASPSRMMPVSVSRTGTNGFVATVYRDGMQDEDYYGTGVCHWELTSIRVGFSATGAKSDTVYVVHLVGKDIHPGAVITQHFWRGDYPSLPGAVETSNAGRRDAEGFGPDFRSNLFSIVATLREKK